MVLAGLSETIMWTSNEALVSYCLLLSLMALFFALLPSDLHICILQTWIGCDRSDSAGSDGQLLRALSALDIACCSAKHRQPCWLELTASLLTIKRDTESYLLWLTNRSVAVRCLVLDDNMADPHPVLALPTISELTFNTLTNRLSLEHVLACCPNLTSIRSSKRQPFWEILATRPPMRLTSLGGDMPEFAQAALLAHGQHLIKLELGLESQSRCWNSAEILEVLPQSCPALESLSLMEGVVSLRGLLVVLRACHNLMELVLALHRMMFDENVLIANFADLTAAATAILEARKLRRLTIVVKGILYVGQEQAFVQLLAAHPELDYLKFQYCCYCRDNAYLNSSLSTEALEKHFLSANMLVNPLHKLRLSSDVTQHLLALSGCSALLCLELCYFTRLSDTQSLCSAVGVYCKQLQCLGFDFGCVLQDEDVIILLNGLPYLKELKVRKGLGITFRTLQAIVDKKCCLTRFCCGQGFPSADVIKFRELAKEAGLIPVASVEPYPTA